MLLRCILLTFLSCIFCFSTFANDECPVGYGYKITQGLGGCVDLGSLNWIRHPSIANNPFYANISDFISKTSGASALYTSKYQVTDALHVFGGNNGEVKQVQNYVCIVDTNYTTAASFKQAMSGVILYYQRATDPYWTPPRDDTVCNFDTSSYEPYGEYILPAIWECTLCPPNTYKDFVGNEPCTPCPNGLLSVAGATNIDQCGHLLHTGNYVAFMPVGRRTEHGLCTMFDGKKYCADVYEKQ
ncbi:MAG: hypothetical protein MJ170_03200 [Alphaproteobacteria bacterium]|nr:hypothetical protein [Alphaproteobacteria bacterium]